MWNIYLFIFFQDDHLQIKEINEVLTHLLISVSKRETNNEEIRF